MFKKIIAGVLVFGMSSLFAMSLSQLNNASKAELMEINGIGEVKAAAIIKERRHGKFKSFEDVQRVEGIGEQTADNIKRGVKSSDGVKKVAKKTKTKAKKKTKTSKNDIEEKVSKKRKSSKKDMKEKAEKKAKKTKSKAKKSTKEKAEKKTKKRKIKSMDEKKKELKKKAKKTKTKKTKAKKTKKTKSKKKN